MLFDNSYKITKENPYDKAPLPYKGLILKKKWKESHATLIGKENIKALFLNMELGWSCDDYSFLSQIPKILEIDIIDGHSRGIEALTHQDELEDIGLNVPDAYGIDWRKFPKLRTLFVYGRKQNESLYGCSSLEELYFDEVKLGDRHSLGSLTRLKKLTIANSDMTNLGFLSGLRHVETLELFNCKKIASFSPIEQLKNLRRLHISGSKVVGDISFLQDMTNLEVLIIDGGKVDSILPLKNLENIKALAIYGTSSSIQDGNLSPIKNFKKLAMLDIPSRASYNLKLNTHWNWNDIDKPRKDWVK
jgi:Leucine-rich repeat (LRR) protein